MALRVALGQFNACVGDIAGNMMKMREFHAQAVRLGADLIVFPEMAVNGYPPEDLLLKNHFYEDSMQAIEQMAKDCPEKATIVGFAEMADNRYFNSLAVLEKGTIKRIYRKMILPNYGVFDEKRYFRSGSGSVTVDINGQAVILTICEDIWHIEWIDKFVGGIYRKDLIVNISASPFHVGKIGQRRDVLSRGAQYFHCPLAYCNLVGGQDSTDFRGIDNSLLQTLSEHRQQRGWAVDSGRENFVNLDLSELRLVSGNIVIIVFQPLLIVLCQDWRKDGRQDHTNYCPHGELERHQV